MSRAAQPFWFTNQVLEHLANPRTVAMMSALKSSSSQEQSLTSPTVCKPLSCGSSTRSTPPSLKELDDWFMRSQNRKRSPLRLSALPAARLELMNSDPDGEKRRRISFEEEPGKETCEPQNKRRRFQRRNSKTSAMLLSSMSSIVSPEVRSSIASLDNSDEALSNIPECPFADDSLDIAEELVRQLRLRRQSVDHSI